MRKGTHLTDFIPPLSPLKPISYNLIAMRLLSLTLESFRSYSKLELSFDPEENVTVLLGDNATGKTNLLEAICVLALLHSPRKVEDADLITWEQTHYRIAGQCLRGGNEELTLEVVSQLAPRKQRACFINGVRTPAMRYIGMLPLVTFTPDQLSLFTGPPVLRRQLLDTLLSQVSSSYRGAIAEYDRAMRQRNSLLHAIREGLEKLSALEPWDEKLSLLGALITVDRLQLFETLQMTILRELTALGEKPESARFVYVRRGEALQEAEIREELLQNLRHFRERDVQMLATSVGPHRDDWLLEMNGRDIATFGSRGQQRAALLSLLLLQASFLEMRTGEKPLLLLDDIFSEFDEVHRSSVLSTLTGNQVIITAVEMEKHLREKAHVMACPLS